MIRKPMFLALTLIAIQPLSASARTPSNNAAAFRTFNLYTDRTTAAGTTDHVNLSFYPSSLNSPAYMVIHTVSSVSDTIALLNLRRYDATGMQVDGSTLSSFSEFSVVPPILATSLGISINAYNVYAGGGAFDDFLKSMALVTVTYEDNTTYSAPLNVDQHVRDFLNDNITCGPDFWLTATGQPYDALVMPLYAAGGRFMDMQELRLPHVTKKITKIRVSASALDHFCSTFVPHVYAGFRLHAASLWPNFQVMTASSQPVVRQSQFTNVDHGGYMFGGIPVGTRRRTNVTACQVASMAMDYTYSGFACTVNGLNMYLQGNRGYEPDQVAIATFVSPSGDAIRYTATGKTTLLVGDKFLVEHATYTNPLATYQVTVAGRNGQATRILTHNATIPSVGDPGRVYWNMKHRVADGFTSSPQLRSIDLPDSPQLAAQVESLLVRDTPVQLNVGARGGHFVVASGWNSSFRPDGSARGTYVIKDPFDDRNFTKLIEGKYQNKFTMARYVVLTGALDVAGNVVTATDPPGLGILASGARRIEVIEPLGRHMLRDASTGEGVYEIPGASVEDVSSEHDNGGDVDDPLTGYDIEIPTTVDGHYTVNVYSDDGLAMSANGYTSTGIFASDDAVDTTAAPIGATYDVLYSGSGHSVTVTRTGGLGVGPAIPLGPSLLRVRHSPTSGPVEFVITGAEVAGTAIEVFDISGRRVDVVQLAGGPGTQMVSWDWRTVGVRPGVYLARLRSRGNELTRFVVLH